MCVMLLTAHHFELLSLKGGCKARLSLHLSKCHIVGNHMSRLILCGKQGEYFGSIGKHYLVRA